MSWLLIGVLTLAPLLAYSWMTKKFGYYEKRGLFSVKPIPWVGNNWDLIVGNVHIQEFFVDIYRKFAGHRYITVKPYNYSGFHLKRPRIKGPIGHKDQ